MRERHERCHGPYGPYGHQWKVVFVGADGARLSRYFESERAANDAIAIFRKNAETRTLQVAVDAYIAGQKKRVTEGELRVSTVEREAFHLRKMLKLDDENGHLDLKRLTPKLAARLYDERVGAVDTHRNGLAVCKAFGRWCAERGWLPVDPFARIKGRGRRKKGKPQLRFDEARTFERVALDLAANDAGAVAALCYLLLGPRSGEVLSRQVRDVDDSGQVLWIPDSKTAAGKRQIRIPRQLAPYVLHLAAGRPGEAPLFAHAAKRARPQDWAREQVWRICKLAGVPEVTPHGLRGTLATMGKELNELTQRVADVLGHEGPAITERSYIDRERAEAAAVERGWQVLEGGTASKKR